MCISQDIHCFFGLFLAVGKVFRVVIRLFHLNHLSANSDQQQFSPNNIHSLSRDKVMRINKMIIIEKIPLISIIEEEQHVGIIEMELSQLTLLTYRN